MIDELEAVNSEEVYLLLVGDRGWPRDRYEAWVIDMCLDTLRHHGVELPGALDDDGRTAAADPRASPEDEAAGLHPGHTARREGPPQFALMITTDGRAQYRHRSSVSSRAVNGIHEPAALRSVANERRRSRP